jgi:hypothetical protein
MEVYFHSKTRQTTVKLEYQFSKTQNFPQVIVTTFNYRNTSPHTVIVALRNNDVVLSASPMK